LIYSNFKGGTLALLISHDLKEKLDFSILIYPLIEMKTSLESYKIFDKEYYFMTKQMIEFFQSQVNFEILYKMMEDQLNNCSKISNTLLIAAELDPVIDNTKKYIEFLQQNNNKCSLLIIKGVIHSYFQYPLYFKEAFAKTENCIDDFLKEIIKPKI
jgi:acetyl esterase/lipase